MIIKYITHNGGVIQGNSPFNVLAELKAGSKFCSEESVEEFMSGFAIRWLEYSGHKIKFNTIEGIF